MLQDTLQHPPNYSSRRAVDAEPIVSTAQGRQQTPVPSVAQQSSKGMPGFEKIIERPSPGMAEGERLYSLLKVTFQMQEVLKWCGQSRSISALEGRFIIGAGQSCATVR